MSKFIPAVDYVTEFEGDEVKMRLLPLKRSAYQQLIPFINKDDKGKVKLTFQDEQAMFSVLADVLPTHCETFSGLKDHEGNEIGLDVMMDNTYFMALMADITQELTRISGMGKKDAKKSEAQPEDNSQA